MKQPSHRPREDRHALELTICHPPAPAGPACPLTCRRLTAACFPTHTIGVPAREPQPLGGSGGRAEPTHGEGVGNHRISIGAVGQRLRAHRTGVFTQPNPLESGKPPHRKKQSKSGLQGGRAHILSRPVGGDALVIYRRMMIGRSLTLTGPRCAEQPHVLALAKCVYQRVGAHVDLRPAGPPNGGVPA